MDVVASVNYHVHTGHAQAFHIDAGGVSGELVSPELVPTEVVVRDVRQTSTPLVFEQDSICFAKEPTTTIDFATDSDWQVHYNAEIETILTRLIDASEVIIFDHTVRVDDPKSDRRPARNVHSDYSCAGAHQRLEDIVGKDQAAEWRQGHFGFVNIWRPIENPITSSPLGFVHPTSVNQQDWLTIDLIYPDRRGEIMGLTHNNVHDWFYMEQMTPAEIAVFNIYDNRGLPSIGHSALDLANPTLTTIPRKSIETRTLVRYD